MKKSNSPRDFMEVSADQQRMNSAAPRTVKKAIAIPNCRGWSAKVGARRMRPSRMKTIVQ
jgi:hypothetical protein